jgi:hypothetical protein
VAPLTSRHARRAMVATLALALGIAGGAGGAAAAKPAKSASPSKASTLCAVVASPAFKKLDDQIAKSGDKVDRSVSGGTAKDGVTGARAVAQGLRAQAGLLTRGGGDAKARRDVAALHTSLAGKFDAVARAIPGITSGLAAAKAGDQQALIDVLDAAGNVFQPAVEALDRLPAERSAVLGGC